MVFKDNITGQNILKVVYSSDVASTTEQYPNYSFLIPRGEEQVLVDYTDRNDRARQSSYGYVSKNPWNTGFEVEKRGDGNQRIRAWSTNDDDRVNTGWYIATKDKITPIKHLWYFGGGAGILAFPVGVISSLLGLVLLSIVRKFFFAKIH